MPLRVSFVSSSLLRCSLVTSADRSYTSGANATSMTRLSVIFDRSAKRWRYIDVDHFVFFGWKQEDPRLEWGNVSQGSYLKKDGLETSLRSDREMYCCIYRRAHSILLCSYMLVLGTIYNIGVKGKTNICRWKFRRKKQSSRRRRYCYTMNTSSLVTTLATW